MAAFLGLAVATFASEDLACIAAGLLIQRGEIGALAGVTACAAGILLGDWGLWAIGRLGGRAALTWPWLSRRFAGAGGDDLRAWLERHDAEAIVTSRFLPGTRLPLYVTAGLLRMSPLRFATWTLVAVLLWTPAIVLLTAWSGDFAGGRFAAAPGLEWAPAAAAAGLLLVVVRTARSLARPDRRRRAAARLARWRRWEFWPMWLFYLPVAAWVALLAIRYRGLTTMTAANPGMPDGGVVGESKFEILSRLPPDATIPAVLVPAGRTGDRVARAIDETERAGWGFPLIMKPDVGQRGVGVRLVRDVEGLREYLSTEGGAVLAQPYHEGPFEAGVFYYRMPGWARGRIFSITDKRFPFLVGDGQSTVEQLIWTHPRYRMQAALFLKRHAAQAARVLEAGERFRLAIAGNHAQGTLFRDGAHLLTPDLERRIDEIARAYPGFFVGRFDIRYRNVEDFTSGRGLAIVELNGATSESTNIYDPSGSLLSAYRQLFRQWAMVFAIGDANRRRGAPVTSTERLFRLLRAHLATDAAYALSD